MHRGVYALNQVDEIKINLDNAGSDLTSGEGGSFYTNSEYGWITGWHISGYPSGSIVLDVWKKTGDIPTNLDSITGSEKPTLTSQTVNSDTNLTTWTDKKLSPGDILGINIMSVSGLKNAVITLRVERC